MKTILVVDDEKSMRDFLSIFLKQVSYRVRCVSSGKEALQLLERELIVKALNRTNGVLNKAASLLNLSFRSFRYRLEKYKIKNIRQELGS